MYLSVEIHEFQYESLESNHSLPTYVSSNVSHVPSEGLNLRVSEFGWIVIFLSLRPSPFVLLAPTEGSFLLGSEIFPVCIGSTSFYLSCKVRFPLLRIRFRFPTLLVLLWSCPKRH